MSTRACAAARRLARGVALCLAACLLAAGLARAADYEEILADVYVNGERRGEFNVYRDIAGEFYFRGADASALGFSAAPAEGELLPLRALRPGEVVFDERTLALRITLPVDRLRGQVYDLTPRRTQHVVEPREGAAFLNYRLAAVQERSGAPVEYALANELAARQGDVLFRNESALVHDASNRALRYATQLVYDRRADQQRWIAGDQLATSGELGSTLPLGGIGVSKLYSMTPYLVRQPLAGVVGAVTSPSQVEVRLGGVPVFREQVAPGPFEVKNLQNYTGAREVEVVVRDALGREQSVGFPYYYADQALRQGLHEYSYAVGALREYVGERNGDYGQGVFSAFHRYGLSDRLTVGLRGEAAQGLGSVGPTVLYRSDLLGALSASVSASQHDGRSGTAAAVGHFYQAQRFALHAMARRFSDGYATAQDLVAPSMVRSEVAYGGSVNDPRWGTVSLDRFAVERRAFTGLPRMTTTQLGYSYTFAARASFFASVARTQEFTRDVRVFAGVMIMLDGATTLSLSAHRENEVDGAGAVLSRGVPAGEGFGYRLGYDGELSGDARQVGGFAQYNARAASFSLDASSVQAGGLQERRVEAAVAGAVTYAGSRVALSRQIDDSFVAVQLASPIEGVRVYSNGQEIGRTDREGRVIVPRVGSFYETQVSIEERDVPLEYTLGELRRVVAPPYRSGSLLAFDVRRLRAVEGAIRVRVGAELRPAANATVTLADGRRFETGRDGRYYAEDVDPGQHAARLDWNGRECRFMLDVPASEDPILALPEVIACD